MRGENQAPAGTSARAAGEARGPRLSQLWAIAAVAVPLAVLSAAPIVAVDLAYHIRAGEMMLDSHRILRTDPFLSWTLGQPWLDQQWGAQLLLDLAYRSAGWFGLATLRALSDALSLILIFLACRAAGAGRRAAAFLTLGSAVFLAAESLRPESFALPCFAAIAWLVAGRSEHPARLWWAIPIQIVWANVHGSFFLGPALLALGGLDDLVRHTGAARRVFGVGAVALLATLMNPFGWRVWPYVFTVGTNPLIRETVREWQPPTVRNWVGIAFFASVALVAALFARRRKPVAWVGLLALALFFAMTLTAMRHMLWWALAAPVVVAGLLASPKQPPKEPARDPAGPLNVVIAGLLAVTSLVPMVRWAPYTGTEPPANLVAYAPAGITGELRQLLSPGERFFNAQEWGSWFELVLPQNPVLADSRFELIPRDVWNEYVAVSEGREGWQEILARWHVSVVALARDQQRDLIPIIRDDPGWQLFYQDGDGFIFTRSEGVDSTAGSGV